MCWFAPRSEQVLFPELPVAGAGGPEVAGAVQLTLSSAQLDPADLAADRLGELGELDPPDPLVGSEVLARVRQHGRRGLGGRLVPGGEYDVALGHGEPGGVGGGDDGG